MNYISFLTIMHYGICVLLVITVLIQFGKGAEAGVFSGSSSGSQGIFSSSTKSNFLTKFTTACAILFMLSSISLGILKSRQAHQSILDGQVNDINVAPLNSDTTTKANETAPTQSQSQGSPTNSAKKEVKK